MTSNEYVWLLNTLDRQPVSNRCVRISFAGEKWDPYNFSQLCSR